jgi:hypothetical protein
MKRRWKRYGAKRVDSWTHFEFKGVARDRLVYLAQGYATRAEHNLTTALCREVRAAGSKGGRIQVSKENSTYACE